MIGAPEIVIPGIYILSPYGTRLTALYSWPDPVRFADHRCEGVSSRYGFDLVSTW
jgi:hypothetical protein